MSSAPASIRTTDPARGMLARPRVGQPAPWPRARGISLIELMIGMTIGLIALLVMMQTFSASNAHKSNTVSGADATTAGHIAMTLIERELLNAGAGLTATPCEEIRVLGSGGVNTISNLPVTIEQDTDADTPTALRSRSDRITIRYSGSSFGSASTPVGMEMPNPSVNTRGKLDIGFRNGDFIMLQEEGKPCVILQLTDDPKVLGNGTWQFKHQSSGSTYNPTGKEKNFFPDSKYSENLARIVHMGSGILESRFDLNYRSSGGPAPNSDLQLTPIRLATAGTTNAIARNVVALRAQYGWWDSTTKTVSFSSTVKAGAGPNDLAAVRVGIVVRASQRDPSYTAPADIKLFEYDNPITISLSGDELRYRYRSYETVVPLRNTLWNRN